MLLTQCGKSLKCIIWVLLEKPEIYCFLALVSSVKMMFKFVYIPGLTFGPNPIHCFWLLLAVCLNIHILSIHKYEYIVMLLTGDNLLAVVRAIIDSPLLADPAEYRHGHVIYFDFLGLFMVILPVRLGTLINVIVIVFVMLRFAYKLLRSRCGKCWCIFLFKIYIWLILS